MATHNPDNERIKRRYFGYLKEAKRYSEPTIDAVAKALARFELDTKHRDFGKFRAEQATAFKRRLAEQTNEATGRPLSKATVHSTLGALKSFFHWLAGQPGFRSKLQYSDADYFNLSEKEVRVATARRGQTGPSVEQVKLVLSTMPSITDVDRRNRALIAFTLLTGARDRAIASFKLKHIDLDEGCAYQDAREVKTKFSKTFNTYFLPVGEEVGEIFTDWVCYLRNGLHWDPDDPLFPATRVAVGEEGHFKQAGIERKHWANAAPIRAIFRQSFQAAGIQYFNPHSFRNTLVRLGQSICKTAEEFKAWSQNLGHEKVLTTFACYGRIEEHRQQELIQGLNRAGGAAEPALAKTLQQLLREMKQAGFTL